MIGLFCKNALKNRWDSAKENYNFKEPTNRSHSIVRWETRRIPCVITHSYVTHDLFICDTWLFHMRDVSHLDRRQDAFSSVMTHTYVWHGAFMCVTYIRMTRFIHVCDVPYSDEKRGAFTCVILQHTATHCNTWQHTATHTKQHRFIHVCDVPYSNKKRDAFTCVMTHSYVTHNSFKRI